MSDSRSDARAGSPGREAGRTALVFVADAESQAVIRQALTDLAIQDVEFTHGTVETATAALARKPSPRLLIIDISGVIDPIARMDQLAEVCEPNTGVIVIGDRNDIILYRNLKAAGVVEYFFKPLLSELLARACNTVLTGTSEQWASRTGKLVFVLGVRGGVGATTIAVNTAWHLAESRQRWVALVDLDLQYGDAALQLDVTPTHALREAFEHPERVDNLFLERGAVHVSERLDLLASLEPLGDALSIEEEPLRLLLENLRNRYRFLFVDIPIRAAARLTQVLSLPSICVVVSDGTLVSARDVARWRVQMGPNTPERMTRHVLNKHRAPGSLPDSEFARAAGQPPDMVIPYDRDIAAAASLGIQAARNCAALNRGLAPLLRELAGEAAEAQPTFLERLFG